MANHTQTGSIDLTATNGVHLYAKAGFENAEDTYATQADLDIQADRIGMVVSNSDASSSLQLTADAMSYIGNHVEIKGTDGTSTVISGGKIQANSLTIGAMATADQANILNSNIQVGGRNLFLGTAKSNFWDVASCSNFNGATRNIVDDSDVPGFKVLEITRANSTEVQGVYTYPSLHNTVAGQLELGETYTLSFLTKASVAGLKISPYHVAEAQAVISSITGSGADYEIPTEWTRYWVTFTCNSPRNAICFYTYGAASCKCWFAALKLEKGNKPTDWTPALEDVNDEIDDAKKTATNYIAADSTGIRIANANPSTATTYQHQTATATEFVVGGETAARFGSDGAQVGRADSEHVAIGSGSVEMVNADGVPMFSTDLDGGVATFPVVYRWTTEQRDFPTEIKNGKPFSYTRERQIDLSTVASGTTIEIKVGASNRFFYASHRTPGPTFDLSGVVTSSNVSVGNGSAESGMHASLDNPITLTAGTSETVQLFANDIVINQGIASKGLMNLTLEFEYDSSTGLLTEYVNVLVYVTSDQQIMSNIRAWFSTTLAGVYSTITTYAPSFTMGTRIDDAGQFSMVGGEGLIATQDHQTALGKYNLEDTNDQYALIIGNGTADANRSNAFAVDWDGGIYVDDHDSPIGTVLDTGQVTYSGAMVANTMMQGASLSLTAGTWLLVGLFTFGTASTSGTRNISCDLFQGTVSGTTVCRQRVVSAAANESFLQAIGVVTPTATTSYSIGGSSSVATSQARYSRLTAVRIA